MLAETAINPEIVNLQNILKDSFSPDRYLVSVPEVATYAENQQQVLRKGSSTHLAEQFVATVTEQGQEPYDLSFFAKTIRAKDQDASYHALATEIIAVDMFKDSGRGFATYEIIGSSPGVYTKADRTEKFATLLTRTIPGLAALDGEIIFNTIEESDWGEVNSNTGTLDRRTLEGVLKLIYFMNSNGLYHRDAQPKNFGRVTSEAIAGDDEFNGIKVIDFEQSRFREAARGTKEKTMTHEQEIEAALDDLLSFYTYINLGDSLGGDTYRVGFLDLIESTYSGFVTEHGGDSRHFRERLEQLLNI